LQGCSDDDHLKRDPPDAGFARNPDPDDKHQRERDRRNKDKDSKAQPEERPN
jgi:hypothetical protein